MAKKSEPRKPLVLPHGLEFRVSAYALATAAGVALLSGQSAHADTIVYNNAVQTVIGGGTITFSPAPVSVSFSSLQFQNLNASSGLEYGANLSGGGRSWNARPLRKGAQIGPTNFPAPSSNAYLLNVTKYFRRGSFPSGTPLLNETFGVWAGGSVGFPFYTGFRFDFHGQPHYGWAEMTASAFSVQPGVLAFEVQLLGVAYEGRPNTPIAAGETSNNVASEPGTLSLLAFGAAGLPFWRKRKNLHGGDQKNEAKH